MPNKIIPFATANDTDRWIVSVDGYIQSFATRDEAEVVYASITPDGEHFDDTTFGSCQMIPPHYRPINKLAKVLNEPEDMTQCLVSQVREIDLVDYIAKHKQRSTLNFERQQLAKRDPAWRRLESQREIAALWGTSPTSAILRSGPRN